jgi:hypothetical protein
MLWVQLIPLIVVVLLLWRRMAKPQRISVTRMWVTPLILCALSAWVIYENNVVLPSPPLEIALALLIGAIVGVPFGILRGMHTDVRRTDRPGVMYLGSSWATLAVFVVAFVLRYVVRLALPVHTVIAAVVGDGLLAFAIVFLAASYVVIFRKYEEAEHAAPPVAGSP